ncbi:MAG: nucleotidyltransferase domain-containing protein [Nocardioides sp.]
MFGSVARHQVFPESDSDLLIEAPAGTSFFEFVGFEQLFDEVLGREVDLVDYGGLEPKLDDDTRREAVLL